MVKSKNERMIERLRKLGLTIPRGAEIERTYVQQAQKDAGALVWYISVMPGNGMADHIIGSQWPVTELLKAEKLDIYLDDYSQFIIKPKGRTL